MAAASPNRAFLGTLLLAALAAAAAIARHAPPAPKPAGAPDPEFSAGRARAVLRRLVGDGTPHPTGSAANARVRGEVVAELERLGYETALQKAFVCGSRYPVCGTVENVLARRPGAGDGRAVLVAAHYDSVKAGPGASDDGMGVAALLETARAVRSDPPRRNPILFLVDDGEERGLLGADAFSSGHPWAKRIGAVVNVEARGTGGASLLFETSDDNAWLVALAAGALARPNTSSVYYTIYKWLPNDTDLTVFRDHGLRGVNFGCIEGVMRYHTRRDDFAHASPATLQHHGDNVLAMTRALAGADLERPRRGNAVFFDVLSLGIVRWPDAATLPLAAIAAAALAMALFRAARRGDLTLGRFGWGLAAAVGGLALAALLGYAAGSLERAAGALPTVWVARPGAFLAAIWTLGLAGAWLPAAFLARRAQPEGIWAGAAVLFAIGGAGLAVAAPGISFLFLLPALAAGLGGLFAVAGGRIGAAAGPPTVVAAFFWLPMAWVLYDALGRNGAPGIALEVAVPALFAAALLPPLDRAARRRALFAIFAVAAAGLATAPFLPRFTPDSPEGVNLYFRRDADSGTTQWLARADSGRLPAALRRFGFATPAQPMSPWSGKATAFAAPAASPALAAPEISILEDRREGGRRTLRARVRSARGADTLFFAFSPETSLDRFAIAGLVPATPSKRLLEARGGWRVYDCETLPPEGVTIEIAARGAIELRIGDESAGLPPGGDARDAARGDAASPIHDGDRTVVVRRAPIP